MNAELTAAGQARIAIPVVWRNEYMAAMRQMSRNDDAVLYQRTLAFAWRWTAAMPWTDPAATRVQLERTNALTDSTDAANEGVQLEPP